MVSRFVKNKCADTLHDTKFNNPERNKERHCISVIDSLYKFWQCNIKFLTPYEMYDYCIVLGPWSENINDWQALKNDKAPFKEQNIKMRIAET